MFTAASNFTISGGNFVNQVNSRTSALNKLSAGAAHSALHDAPARTDESRCHQNTRVNVLENLERWAQGICDEGTSLFWLHGGAGAGKSAIMQSLAERCAAQGLALGSFFFSRSDPTRNTAEVLIPTLAYQLAQLFPPALDVLEPIVDCNPLIFKKSLQVQLLDLLVPPLQHLVQLGIISDTPQSPRVFLIDGLDECSDSAQHRAIIQAVAAACHKHHVPVKFLIASRPEQAISTSFGLYKEENRVLGAISLSEDADAGHDIRRFIENEFLKIRLQHTFKKMIPSEWPDLDDIDKLVRKSSSHFIYASTAMKYIWSAKESPVRSLQVVLGLEVSRTTSPFAELDALYHHILDSAAHRDKVLQILAYCVFTWLPSLVAIASIILDYSSDDFFIFMADVTPLVRFQDSLIHYSLFGKREKEVKLLHASLGDFLCDPSRSGSLYVKKEVYAASTLERCFQLLDFYSQELPSRQGWPRHTLDSLDGPYSTLSDHIIGTIRTTGHHVTTQEALRRYSLRDFHECRLRFDRTIRPEGICIIDPRIERASSFFMAVYVTKPFDGAQLFRGCLEDFLDILESHIIADGGPLAAAILPLICLRYPSKAIQEIHVYPYRSESYGLLAHSSGSVTVLDLISAEDLASIRHSIINTSPKRLSVAAEAILGFLIDDVELGRSSTHSAHKSWLQRTKPGKHVARGAPRLASVFHKQCILFSALERNEINMERDPDGESTDGESTNGYSGLTPYIENTLHSRLHSLSILLRAVGHLLGALLWVLPKADFSEKLVRYSKRMFPRIMYQRDTVLVRRVRNCLDEYTTRVQNAKLEELGQRIEKGDVDALIEKSHMLYLNAQD
ncbi:hypothetical protein D9619_011035 [Psilocybe cf. subviscida]|uniref:Nephrocystin 3-like N-terminal domain-containing protein n=1 Tax=Psilocybe cf. subviscida TaxID=2480587 RepID=A0A8H5B8B7_9AGAR|nr:hypothetical protein D9619_011035 [Psilocybe cf. subviscida]